MDLPALNDDQERIAVYGVGAVGAGALVFGEGTTRALGGVALVVALFLAWKNGMFGLAPGLFPGQDDDGDGGNSTLDPSLPSLDTWINVLETSPDGQQRAGTMRLRYAGRQFLSGGENGWTIEPADAVAHAALDAYVVAANTGSLPA